MLKVCKFGGTSMASAATIEKVQNIVLAEKARKFVVVSAPGKRNSGDVKITDRLYRCFDAVKESGTCKETFAVIRERYTELVANMGVAVDIKTILDEIERNIDKSQTADYAASCGEYLSALILSAKMGFEFIDAKELIMFDEDGAFNSEYTNDIASARLAKVKGGAVIPGFYGVKPDGSIKTFSRGGSDITGAIIARAVSADVYENWTDVSGFMTADPKVVENPRPIKALSYKELRELSYMGAAVLHPESIFPVRNAGIPINIRNTFDPGAEGTMIVPVVTDHDRLITGIAGKKGFTSILVEKSMMNNEVGFTRKMLSVLERYGISFEHLPSGIDTMTVVISDSVIGDKMQTLLDGIKKAVDPDRIEICSGLSLIATVGHGMSYKPGTAARLFSALSRYGINIRMIDQGSSELNIIVAVGNDDYEKAINAIYEEFVY